MSVRCDDGSLCAATVLPAVDQEPSDAHPHRVFVAPQTIRTSMAEPAVGPHDEGLGLRRPLGRAGRRPRRSPV